MSGFHCPDVRRRRFAWASCLVAVGLAALTASGAAQARAEGAAAAQTASLAGIGAVLGEQRDGFLCAQDEVPDAFTRELLSVEDVNGLRCDAASHLVGFERRCGAPEAMRQLRASLEQRGWRAVDGLGDLCATFSKDEGACRWAFATCVQTGEGASVVVQWSENGKEGS